MAQFVKVLDTDNQSWLIRTDKIMYIWEDGDHQAVIKLEDGKTIYTRATHEQFENIFRREYDKK